MAGTTEPLLEDTEHETAIVQINGVPAGKLGYAALIPCCVTLCYADYCHVQQQTGSMTLKLRGDRPEAPRYYKILNSV